MQIVEHDLSIRHAMSKAWCGTGNFVAGFLILIFLWASSAAVSAQSVIRVPQNHATLQAAIDAATNGDTVLVAPGVYVENIRFYGKAITIASEGGANATVIDGNDAGSVVMFADGEGTSSRLTGFTLRNGRGVYDGGGINITGAAPTISDNVIVNNRACGSGMGIYIGGGSPIIRRNIIGFNTPSNCGSGFNGGGIAIIGNGGAQILDNVIVGNAPGGIALFSAGSPLISGNIVIGNSTGQGGGISIVNQSDASIIQNLIVGNSASEGGGIYWGVPQGSRGPLLVNNTLADNDSPRGSGILAAGFDAETRMVNNVIVAKPGQTALYCDELIGTNAPIVQFNNIYSPSGTAYGGICPNTTGTSGNISAAPLFADPVNSNYRLTNSSPGVDAGSNTAAVLPALDLDGNTRIRDGDANGAAIVDMGAYELTSTPHSIAISTTGAELGSHLPGAQPVSNTVTISNTGTGSANVVLSAIASNDPASFVLTSGGPTPCAGMSPTLGPGTSCTMIVTFTPISSGSKNALLVVMSNAAAAPATAPFKATVIQTDSIPDNFFFAPQFGVAPSSAAVSNSVTVTGIDVPVTISIEDGEYSINGGPFTANQGVIANGQSVAVRVVAPANNNEAITATLTIGTVSGNFLVTTTFVPLPPPPSPYFPIAVGNSWVTSRNGVIEPATTITGTQFMNGSTAAAFVDAADGSVSYISNDGISGGVRLHRVYTPSSFIPSCGSVAETDNYNSPALILPAPLTLGRPVSNSGVISVDLGACGSLVFGYTATSTPLAIERVTVPAGQFDALRVQLDMSIPGNGSTSTTLWFAAGIGQVKELDADGTVIELVSTNIVRTVPDEISFTAQTNIPVDSSAISNPVTISGITAPAAVSITGGEYSINGGAFTSQPGTVANGQSIRVRLTSSAQPFISTSATLNAGGVAATFRVTTGLSAPSAPTAVRVSAGPSSVVVSFTAPTNTGGAVITGYTVTCMSSNGGATGSNTTTAGSTLIRVNGLTNGKQYTCTVTAGSSVGNGATSAATNAATPFDITPILMLLME